MGCADLVTSIRPLLSTGTQRTVETSFLTGGHQASLWEIRKEKGQVGELRRSIKMTLLSVPCIPACRRFGRFLAL